MLETARLTPRRLQSRAEILALAARQTVDMDGQAAPSVDPARPLFVTGHQPDLYHPGIWVKNFIVDGVCRGLELVGLNLTVDSDQPSSRGVDLPVFEDGTWHRRQVVVADIRLGVPWERQPPLTRAGWQRLLDTISSPLPPSLRQTFDAFGERVLGTPSVLAARTLADSLARARRAWEGTAGRPHYLELDVSSMCSTAAFHAFVATILAQLEDFWEIHNSCLDAYRRERHIRTPANPVPNLRRRDDLWETPFWCVHPGGERGGLFLERDGTTWKVESKDTTFGVLRSGDEEAWAGQLQAMMEAGGAGIRPRALTLTMFARHEVADLFLHGVGGARYERVGDAIVKRFFGDESAPYAVASATFCPDGLDNESAEDLEHLARTHRELVYNPQRLAPGIDGADRKMALVEAIASAPRGEKKSLGLEIAAVNADMRARLGALEQELERRTHAAEEVRARQDVTRWRGYPYFLFKPGTLRASVDRA